MTEDILNAINRVKVEQSYLAYVALSNLTADVQGLGFNSYRIAILRNFTIEPLIPVIKGEAIRYGLAPDIYISDFDAIAESVMNESSDLYKKNPDIIIIAQWGEGVSPALSSRFIGLSKEEVDNEVSRIVSTTKSWFSEIRKKSNAPVLINNFISNGIATLGILDYQSDAYQKHTLSRLNKYLLEMSKDFSDIYWVDLCSLFSQIGYTNSVNEHTWQTARAPISKNALLQTGLEFTKYIRALNGKARKCLVLDCDNTLWGGVIGEDGLDGIRLGNDYPGSAFINFQQECLNLYNRGIILALCSKNNETDALEVFRKHEYSILKEHHFSTWQINWDDKAKNLCRIAEDLNIGIDSLVFVDDNSFECQWVLKQLPQVEVINLSKEPFNYRNELMSFGFFDTLTFSGEDKKRSQMYVSDNQRKVLLKSASSYEDYLNELFLEAEIGRANKDNLSRISQLTQKTNQFNLTTRRYTEGDIDRFLNSNDMDVYYLKLKDRISDLGLIGVAIVKYKNSLAYIDSFMMSCRALGRGAEDVLMSIIIQRARKLGCNNLIGTYIETNKNIQVSNFFDKQKFIFIEKIDNVTTWNLKIELNSIKKYPKWIIVKENNL